MADSGAMEDSLLEGFADPWPRPRSPTTATATASSEGVFGGGEEGGRCGQSNGGVFVKGEGGAAAAVGAGVGARAAEGCLSSRLRLPQGVLLTHAVQVWNALCVLPRPMGLRPPPTLDQLMQAIATLSPRWSKRGGSSGNGGGGEREGKGRARGEGGEEEADGEAEFDERRASIRGAKSRRGGRKGKGRGGGGGGGGRGGAGGGAG